MCWQQTRGQSCVDGEASRTRVLLCLALGGTRGKAARPMESCWPNNGWRGALELQMRRQRSKWARREEDQKLSFYYNWASRDEASAPPRDYAKRAIR